MEQTCFCVEIVKEMASFPLAVLLSGTENQGMKQILTSKTIDELGEEGKSLIEWCIDFLLFDRGCLKFPKNNVSSEEEKKYKNITIRSFIYDFLKIEKDSYDYWLMLFLGINNIIRHGNNCDKLIGFRDRKLTRERCSIILNWIQDCPDDV